MIVGVVLFFGGGPNHDRLGFRYWKDGNAFRPYIVGGAAGRFCGFWNSVVRAGYSVIMSPELITIASGEAEAPRRNTPKATKRFIYRLVFFYVFSVLVIGCIVSSSDPRLLNAVSSGVANAAASPFVIGIQNAGIPILNHIINAAILTSAWSAANSFLFAGSRSLYSLSLQGKAPKVFRYCNRKGVPYVALLAVSAIGCLGFLNASASSANVFTWFTNLSTIAGFIAWICILITYLRFRRAMAFNNILDTLPFKTAFQPYTTWVALVLLVIITITNGFTVFVGGSFTGADFVAAYITLPIFVVLYLGHKIYYRRWRWFTPTSEVDVTSGLSECEAYERSCPERVPRNALEKVWMWIA
ncbi:proline permease PUT4 [Sugiyamaella lignohabitans]|uniref:Proline permease PUT4 n=1 Tax=Sugiyamaella lignohabitans TaxID=796027 RepID=A0A167EFR2_9ASCO|nr:proline permease PUT4 [Sugiyamaella lignohabitans]ANB14024.1 proline permease PUT4 [Sugiyamaella lignohabitans]